MRNRSVALERAWGRVHNLRRVKLRAAAVCTSVERAYLSFCCSLFYTLTPWNSTVGLTLYLCRHAITFSAFSPLCSVNAHSYLCGDQNPCPHKIWIPNACAWCAHLWLWSLSLSSPWSVSCAWLKYKQQLKPTGQTRKGVWAKRPWWFSSDTQSM